jgi:hypothetical protein
MPLNASCNGLMLNMLLLDPDDFKDLFSFFLANIGGSLMHLLKASRHLCSF